MNEADNIAIVRRYFEEVWNRGDLDAAADLVADDFSVEGCGGAISGLDAVKLYVSSYRAACPRVRFTMLSVIAEGDFVMACWVGSALCGDSEERDGASGKCSTGLSVYRIADGKIAEAWAGSDGRDVGSARRLGIRNKD